VACSPPSPEQQVRFLQNIQRLLGEGLFVASYKFALIRALADLAVLKGDDSGEELVLRTRDIATHFVDLYWRQARPFHNASGDVFVLQQNTGKQAAIVSRMTTAHRQCGGSLYRFQQTMPDEWKKLVGDVDQVVRVMPLWKLQTVGDERLDCLYENVGRGTRITLKRGVAFCLRAFYALIRDLVEGAWVRFVQALNARALGSSTDMGSFLFGQERATLAVCRPVLLDVQRGLCLYCQRPLRAQAEVDHFIPWSRYPADIGQNLVLAHSACNRAKADFVAAEQHLAAWVERNAVHRDELRLRMADAGVPTDVTASERIAKWIYGQTEQAAGQVWVKESVMQRLGPCWARCFAA
jgi:hypothetical protein